MKFIVTIVTCILYSAVSFTQVDYDFLTFGDTTSNDRGSASFIDEFNNAFYTGTVSNGMDGSDDIFFCKINPDGSIAWQYTYGSDDNEFVNNMIRSSEGYFYICGDATDADDGNVNGFLLKLTEGGVEQWFEEYGFTNLNEDFYGITELSTSEIAVVGFKSAEIGTGNDVLIVKYDTEGNVIQKIFYGDTINDYGMGIVEGENGNIYISGDRQLLGTGYNAFIAEFDSEGNIIWDYVNGFEFNNGCKTMIKNSNGNFILVGESALEVSPVFNIMISEIDSAGNFLWSNWIGEAGAEAAYDVSEPAPGNYLITGFGYNSITLNNDIILVHTDQNGNELSRKYFGGDAVDYSYDIKSDTAGNYWISGFTQVQGELQFALIYDSAELNYLAVHSEIQSESVRIYPNPSNGHINIETELRILSVEIYNAQGQLISDADANNFEFDLSQFDGQFFIIRVITVSETFVQKIIVN